LFGDFDIRVVVFSHQGKQIDIKEYKGMNGTFKGANNLLNKCKEEILSKYN